MKKIRIVKRGFSKTLKLRTISGRNQRLGPLIYDFDTQPAYNFEERREKNCA